MDLALFILILQIGFNSALNYRHSNRMAVIPSSRLFNIELSRRSAPYNRNLQRTSRSYSGSDSEETDFDYTSYEEPISFTSFKLYKRRKNPTQVTKAHNEAKFEQSPSKLHSDNHAGPLDKKGTDFRRPYILHGTQNRRLGPTSIHDIKDLEDVVHRRAANYLKLLFTIIEEQNSRRNLNDDRKVPINSPATSSANFLGSRFVETANRRRSNHEVGNRYRTDSRNNQPLPLKRAGSFDAAPPMPVSRSQLRIPDPLKPSKHETARRRDDDYNNDVDYNNEENDGNEDEDGNNDDNDDHDHRHIGGDYYNVDKEYDHHHEEYDHNNDENEYNHHHAEYDHNNDENEYNHHDVEDEYNNDENEYNHHHLEDEHYFKAYIKPFIDFALATYDDSKNKSIASPTAKALLDKLKVLPHFDQEDKNDTKEVKSLRLSDLVDIKSRSISHNGKLGKSKEDKKNTGGLLVSPIHRSSDLTEKLGDLKVIPINLTIEIKFNNEVREEQHESHKKRLDPHTILTNFEQTLLKNDTSETLGQQKPHNELRSGECPEQSRTKHNNTDDESSATDSSSNNTEDDSDSDKSHEDENDRDQENSIDIPVNKDDDNKTDIFPETEPLKTAEDANETNSILNLEFPLNDILSSSDDNNTSSEVEMEDFLRNHDSRYKPEYSDLLARSPSDNNNNTSSEVDMEDFLRGHDSKQKPEYSDLMTLGPSDNNNNTSSEVDMELTPDDDVIRHYFEALIKPLIYLVLATYDDANNKDIASPTVKALLGKLKVLTNIDEEDKDDTNEVKSLRLSDLVDIKSPLISHDGKLSKSKEDKKNTIRLLISPIHRSSDLTETLEVDMEDFLRNHDSKHKPEYLNLEYPWASVFTDETAIRKDEDQTLDLEYLWKNVINTEDNKNSKQITNSLQLGVPQLEDTVYNQLRNHKKHTGKVDTNKLKQQPAKSKASPDEGISTEKISSHSSDPLYEHPLLRQHKQKDQRAFHDTRDNYLRQFGSKLNLSHYSNNNEYNPAQNYLRDVPNEPDISDEDGEGRAFIMVPLDRRPLTRLRTQEDLPYILNVLGPQLRRSTYNDTIIFPSD
ncbi:hypothetical protein B5X24_HaOG206093 [Helicoverpa armigera]|uniref:Uncharacterized protein n=1 Tax=Helicoverpa armigera TaxID=29058 RepID=A0A2W1BP73_HELAM|nr:hypothetical protein B5X24_HaOG206093 [Helicoverpa armigera]